MLTKVLAAELAKDNIQVNAIAPGYVKTRFSAAIWDDIELNQATLQRIPQKRMAEPDEISGAALYLASSESSFMTGETIVIDGGQSNQKAPKKSPRPVVTGRGPGKYPGSGLILQRFQLTILM